MYKLTAALAKFVFFFIAKIELKNTQKLPAEWRICNHLCTPRLVGDHSAWYFVASSHSLHGEKGAL